MRVIPILISVIIAFSAARGAPLTGGMTRPLRITAGASNQFMGVLSPNQRDLYFVTDKHATYEVYHLDIINKSGGRVMDLDADVIQPRIDAKGRYLLYISFRNDADGDVCIRDIKKSKDWCITGSDTSDLQAFFSPDSSRVYVLQRTGLHQDLRLVSIPLHGGRPKVVLKRNMASPGISRDGRYLIFVPIDRLVKDVGITFAVKAGQGFTIMDMKTGKQLNVVPDLPGKTSFPVFSRDGRYIYFTQYLNDTNHDGYIDGNDNGVLFRMPFQWGNPKAFQQETPEQLTSAAWNCQYPYPTKDKLIATCARFGSLDIYSMPLDGAIPSKWGRDRVWQEVWASRDASERLLLLYRLSTMEKKVAARVEIYRRIALIHLDRREFESAGFYMDKVSKMATRGVIRDWAWVFKQVLAHRLAMEQPNLDEAKERQQAEKLDKFHAHTDDGQAMARMAESEVLDDVGSREQAETLLERIKLETLKDFSAVLYAAQRFETFYGGAGDKDKVLHALSVLSLNRELPIQDRLFLADRYTDWLLRGTPADKRPALVKQALAQAPEGSVLKFRLQVAKMLLGVGKQDPEAIRKQLFKLYRANKNLTLRKVLVQQTAAVSADKDQEYLLYQFSNSWVSYLRHGLAERKYAEDLYKETVLERAYDALAKGHIQDARGSFFGVVLKTNSLEANIGLVEARLKEGKDPAKDYASRYKSKPNHPVYLFVRAYLIARTLARLHGQAFGKAARQAKTWLEKAAPSLDNRAVFHQLFGYIAHLQYLRTHNTAFAQQAIAHYQLAADLGRNNIRVLAPIRLNLALLQTALGNFQPAIGEFRMRLRYPFMDPARELAARMGLAECLFMQDHNKDAVNQAKQALELVKNHEDLNRWLGFVLDKAVIYSIAAQDYQQAFKMLKALGPIIAKRRNHHDHAMFYLSKGSVALGGKQCKIAIQSFEKAEQQIKAMPALPAMVGSDWGGAPRPRVFQARDLLILDYGLMATAYTCDRAFDKAAKALKRRLELLQARRKAKPMDNDLLEIANTGLDMAMVDVHLGKYQAAARHISLGVASHDRFAKNTGTPFTMTLVRLVSLAAKLHFQRRVSLKAFGFDLPEKVKQIQGFVTKYRKPQWAGIRQEFMLYSTQFNLEGGSK